MKATARMITAVAAGFLFTSFAQAAQDIPFSGFLGNPAVYEQLQPGRHRHDNLCRCFHKFSFLPCIDGSKTRMTGVFIV